jgi:hypothetical protein
MINGKLNGAEAELPGNVAFEIIPHEGGVAIALTEILETKANGDIVPGTQLVAALTPHQARTAAGRLLMMADALSEPKTISVMVVTPVEAWIDGQQMITRRKGAELHHSYALQWKKEQLLTPKRKPLIIPGG